MATAVTGAVGAVAPRQLYSIISWNVNGVRSLITAGHPHALAPLVPHLSSSNINDNSNINSGSPGKNRNGDNVYLGKSVAGGVSDAVAAADAAAGTIRAAASTIVCYQETKLSSDADLTPALALPTIPAVGGGNAASWDSFWSHSRARKGYSGVATFAPRGTTLHAVRDFFGLEEFDREGRALLTDHDAFLCLNVYFPNGQQSAERLEFKFRFFEALFARVRALERGTFQQEFLPDIKADISNSDKGNKDSMNADVANAGASTSSAMATTSVLSQQLVPPFARGVHSARDLTSLRAMSSRPRAVAVVGDVNIALRSLDVYSPRHFAEGSSFLPGERLMLARHVHTRAAESRLSGAGLPVVYYGGGGGQKDEERAAQAAEAGSEAEAVAVRVRVAKPRGPTVTTVNLCRCAVLPTTNADNTPASTTGNRGGGSGAQMRCPRTGQCVQSVAVAPQFARAVLDAEVQSSGLAAVWLRKENNTNNINRNNSNMRNSVSLHESDNYDIAVSEAETKTGVDDASVNSELLTASGDAASLSADCCCASPTPGPGSDIAPPQQSPTDTATDADASNVLASQSQSQATALSQTTSAVVSASVAGAASDAASGAGAGAEGPFLWDAFRVLHPHARAAYTCWNTLKGLRGPNLGCRIDYTLLSHSLTFATERTTAVADPTAAAVAASDSGSGSGAHAVQRGAATHCLLRRACALPRVMGSDHCPVLVSFLASPPLHSTVATGTAEAPPLCARRAVARLGSMQALLGSFFAPKSNNNNNNNSNNNSNSNSDSNSNSNNNINSNNNSNSNINSNSSAVPTADRRTSGGIGAFFAVNSNTTTTATVSSAAAATAASTMVCRTSSLVSLSSVSMSTETHAVGDVTTEDPVSAIAAKCCDNNDDGDGSDLEVVGVTMTTSSATAVAATANASKQVKRTSSGLHLFMKPKK